MNADGTVQANATLNGAEDLYPAWSPDGTKIAFEAAWAGDNPDIWVMNADGTGWPDLLTTSDAPDGAPAWSPW